MPEALAGSRLERDDRIAKEVGAMPIAAVEIVFRAGRRHVDDSAFLIDGLLTPVVGAADRLPGIFRPRVVPELAGAGHGMKRPHQLAGSNIECAHVSRG